MRLSLWLLLALVMLGLIGCSGGASTSTPAAAANPVVVVVPPGPPIVPTALNASTLATAALEFGSVRAIIPRDGGPGSLPAVDASSPSSTALSLVRAVSLRGSGTISSPLGGTAVLTQTGNQILAHFDNLRTLEGTLSGDLTVILTGTGSQNQFQARASFNNLLFQTPDTTLSFTGSGIASVTQTTSTFNVRWDSSLVMADQAGSFSIATQNLVTTSEISLAQNLATASVTMSGNLVLQNFKGVTGNVNLTTASPLVFAGIMSNNLAQAELGAGSLSFNDGQMNVAVVAPNTVKLTVAGTFVKDVPWAYLGGADQFVLALRPLVADTIFTGGTILTVDSQDSKASALAVQDDRILAVGPTSEVSAFQADTTQVVSLAGNTLMPGFVEPHMHMNLTALTTLAGVNPQIVQCGSEALGNTIQQVLANLTAALQQVPDAAALYGFSFDPSRLAPPELMSNLTLQQLDSVSATIPIVVQNASQHISYANSPAFRATGIWPSAPNPPYVPPPAGSPLAGFIPVDPVTGLPTGQLNEEAAQAPFLKVALAGALDTKFKQLQYAEHWRVVTGNLAKVGITTMSDQLTGSFLGIEGESELLSLLALDLTNPVRMRSYIDSSSVDLSTLNIFPGEGYERLRFIGAKFVTDGSTQGLTAGLNFNYIFPGPFPVAANGLLDFASAMVLFSTCQPWYDRGFQLCFHANGDAAQAQVFQVLQMLQQGGNPKPDPRFRMEHFTVLQSSELAQHIAQAKALKVDVGHTVGHVFFWGQVFNDTLLGAGVAQNIDPIASELAAGLHVATHSDSPVSTPNPLRNIQTASTRIWQAPPQQVLGPEQIVTVPQAIRTVTFDAAHALMLENQVGSLEVGKLADLVVLDADPTAVSPTQISSIKVLSTYLAGRRVSGN